MHVEQSLIKYVPDGDPGALVSTDIIRVRTRRDVGVADVGGVPFSFWFAINLFPHRPARAESVAATGRSHAIYDSSRPCSALRNPPHVELKAFTQCIRAFGVEASGSILTSV